MFTGRSYRHAITEGGNTTRVKGHAPLGIEENWFVVEQMGVVEATSLRPPVWICPGKTAQHVSYRKHYPYSFSVNLYGLNPVGASISDVSRNRSWICWWGWSWAGNYKYANAEVNALLFQENLTKNSLKRSNRNIKSILAQVENGRDVSASLPNRSLAVRRVRSRVVLQVCCLSSYLEFFWASPSERWCFFQFLHTLRGKCRPSVLSARSGVNLAVIPVDEGAGSEGLMGPGVGCEESMAYARPLPEKWIFHILSRILSVSSAPRQKRVEFQPEVVIW